MVLHALADGQPDSNMEAGDSSSGVLQAAYSRSVVLGKTLKSVRNTVRSIDDNASPGNALPMISIILTSCHQLGHPDAGLVKMAAVNVWLAELLPLALQVEVLCDRSFVGIGDLETQA